MLWKSDWLRNFSMKAFRLVFICRYIDSKREFPFWPEAILRFYTSNFHEASHIAAPTRKITLNRLLSWFEMTFHAPSESVLAMLLEHMVEQFCICRFTRQVRATCSINLFPLQSQKVSERIDVNFRLFHVDFVNEIVTLLSVDIARDLLAFRSTWKHSHPTPKHKTR